MKQSMLVLTLALLIAVPNLGSSLPQPPATHPPVSLPPADHLPAQNPQIKYADHLLSIEGVVSTLLETISSPRGVERDWDKYKELYFPEARVFSARLVHDSAIVGGQTVEEFIQSERKYLLGAGYFEKSISMKIEQFGHIAHVRSVYESRRRAEDEKPYTRGIYSIQLVETGGRWWILNILWQAEDPQNPIPEEYLK